MSSLRYKKGFGKVAEVTLYRNLPRAGKNIGQFGFVQGRSTEDAIVEMHRIVSASSRRYFVALFLDISRAFDNVRWPLVLKALKNQEYQRNAFKVMTSYFENRKVKIALGGHKLSKQASRGCLQESVLGPSYWNLIFDQLLRILEKS